MLMVWSVCNIRVINVYLHRAQFCKPRVFCIQMSILFKLILPRDSAKAAIHSSDVWEGRWIQTKVNALDWTDTEQAAYWRCCSCTSYVTSYRRLGSQYTCSFFHVVHVVVCRKFLDNALSILLCCSIQIHSVFHRLVFMSNTRLCNVCGAFKS
jgi:hypothetical protein